MNQSIIKNCIDLLAGFEHLPKHEQNPVFNNIIDTLGSYPKPKKKGDTTPTSKKLIGAYLFVSNSRNACKLCERGFIDTNIALHLVTSNLENALSLLID